jgi:hypothetical protein
MAFVDQWQEIERELPEDWADARLQLNVEYSGDFDRAVSLLAPLGPGRAGGAIRFTCEHGSGGVRSPEGVTRALRRLDAARMHGRLTLVAAGTRTRRAEEQRPSLAAHWEELASSLPADWSDVYAEVELTSTDYIEHAALLMSPLNPLRADKGSRALRFRCARVAGYGASASMVRRCFERCDAKGITGSIRILRVLSETHHVATQGPVWYVGGRSV